MLDDSNRAQRAILTLAQTRAGMRALFLSPAHEANGQGRTFPRSKTFRWLLQNSVGRWIGIASLTSTIARLLR